MSAAMTITGFADEIAADAGEQIAGLQAAGVRHVEVRGVDGSNVLDLSDDEALAFRGRLDAAGIGVSSVGSPIGKVQVRSDLEAHFGRLQIALRRADQLGCRFVRVFSFYHEDEEAGQIRDEVIGFFRRATQAAAAAGVVLLHENESGIYGDTPQRCADLLTAIDDPHLRAAFDPANFVTVGSRPAQAWQLLDGYVDYFHIKDAVAGGSRVVPAGHGDGDLAAVLGAAQRRGFAGFLSVEPHLKADDPDYGGSGAERFRTAVDALRALLDELGAAHD